jgi:hypothetical protein
MFFKNNIEVIGVLILIIAVLYINGKPLAASQSNAEDGIKLYKFFKKSGVNPYLLVLHHSSAVADNQSESMVLKMREKIENTFEVEMIRLTNDTNKDLIKYQGERKLSPDTKIQIVWVGKRQQDQKKLKYMSFIVARLITDEPNEISLVKSYSFLSSWLEEISVEPQINTSIQGSLEKTMDKAKQIDFLKSMFQSAKGTILENLESESVVSYTGYTKMLERSVFSSGNKINIHLASHYNHLNGKTLITIGNPVISIEY